MRVLSKGGILLDSGRICGVGRTSGFGKRFVQVFFRSNPSTNLSFIQIFPYFWTIWKEPIPHKVQVFTWSVALNKLPACDILQKRWPSCALSLGVFYVGSKQRINIICFYIVR